MLKRLLTVLLLFASACFAQGIRFDSQISQEFLTTAINGATNFLTIPSNAQIAFCNFPANAVPCTNKATTYSSNTLGTPCSTSTQIVLVNTTSCVASPDAQQNWGVWVAAGSYAYTITVGGANLGPYNLTLGCAAGTTCVSAGGNNNFTGANTIANLNNVLWIDGVKYTTMGACYAALPSSGGTCEVPPNYTETLAANLVLSKSNSGFHFNGPALITQGSFQITAAGGIDGLFIVGPWPMDPLQGYQGVEFSYSGTSDAMVFGNSSTHSYGLRLENFWVNMSASSGQCHHVVNTTTYDIRNVGCGGPGSSDTVNGLVLDGTGLFTGDGTVINYAGENICSTLVFTGTSGHGANNNTVLGGKAAGTQAGCTAMNFLDGDVNKIIGFDIETAPTAVAFANIADVFGNDVEIYNEGNTTDVSFGAASSYNRFVGRNQSPVVAGAGAPPTNSNSVVWYDSFAQDASGNFYLNLIKSKTGTATMGLTLKGGSGSGNYTSASTTFAAVDATNLTFTVTVPTGWKLGIQAFGTVTTATGVATANVNLTNGTCGSGTALSAMQYSPAVASAPGSFALGYVLAGSGSSVTINLCYDTSNAADSVTILNSSASLQPQMIFTLMPSN